jgi:hypothetical protein
MCYSMTWKICLGVLIISVLAWLPQGVTPAHTWLSPALCWAGDGPNPEVFTISVIKYNTLTEGVDVRSYAKISHSFAGFKGISQTNQASGSLNNQANVVSIPGKIKPWHQKSVVKDNTYVDPVGDKHHSCSITGGSYKHGAGIAEINQASGHMNSQLNAVGLNVAKNCKSLSDDELCTKQTFVQGTNSDPRKCSNFTGVWASNQISGDMNSGQTLTQINIIPVHK